MSIKDMPHATVEQVLALRRAAIELENKNYYLESKLAEERQGRDDAESLYIENLKKELATLKASLPKIKADAVRDYAKNMKSIEQSAKLKMEQGLRIMASFAKKTAEDHANKLEAGE